MRQLTLRGFDKELERRLREVARTRRVSLNQAALILLREGVGLLKPRRRARVAGDTFDHLIGSWPAEEEAEFLDAAGSVEIDSPPATCSSR
jgi:hypothetical protein